LGKLFITVTTLILLSSQLLGSNTYTGTFSVQMIRTMWRACFQGASLANPITPHFNADLCDCVINKTREKYTVDDVQKYKGIKMQNNYTKMANDCKVILEISTPTPKDFS